MDLIGGELKKLLVIGEEIAGAKIPQQLIQEANSRGGIDFSALNYAVSFSVPFPGQIINQLREGPSRTYLYYYNVLNTRIDQLAIKISSCLESKGYKAFPIPASQRVRDRYQSIFSQRGAAYAAGLGWIGKSCNLITVRKGPRIRLGTVLTDAEVLRGYQVEDQCGTCKICQDACPAQAIKGINFEPNIPFEERFDPQACSDYKNKVRDKFGKRVCGICLAVCPQGDHQLILKGRDNDHPLVSQS